MMAKLDVTRILYTLCGFLVLLWHHHLVCVTASRSLSFDNYGHCGEEKAYQLRDDDYILLPTGSTFVHESKFCHMTFEAPSDYGICLTFEEFEITDCNVKFKIFNSESNSGNTWRVLDCYVLKPNQMCTISRYVTVEVSKENLNHNKDYKFKVRVEKSKSTTEEGVLIASIAVFVGIILGVVALIAISALSIVYCCCKRKKQKKKKQNAREGCPQMGQNLVQPSAPPVEIEDQHWGMNPQGDTCINLPYGHYHPEYPPPPYVPPPSYQVDDPLLEPSRVTDPDQTYPMKQ